MIGCNLSTITPKLQLAEFKTLCLEGGGFHNHVVYSPNGDHLVASSDVGGLRYYDRTLMRWQYLPVLDNASRQVAGAVVTDDGKVYALVGNSPGAGQLQCTDITTGQITVLNTGLDVSANSESSGDVGARPRPSGYVVAYDPVRQMIYQATEDGLHRHDLTTGQNQRIALAGESVRAIAHTNDGVLNDPAYLVVATRDRGIMQINNPTGPVSVSTLIDPPSRFEDVVWVDETAGSFLAVAHDQGVFYYDGTTVFDVTPLNGGVGNNGGDIRYISAAVEQADNGDYVAALGVVNPASGDQWVYRNLDIEMADATDWEGATPEPATIAKGSTYNSPATRLYGNPANGGVNLLATSALAFQPDNPDVLTSAANLSLYQTQNFTTDTDWSTFNEGLSVVSIADIHMDAEGYSYYAGPDHNFFVLSPTGYLAQLEPDTLSVQGIRDGWSVTSVGTGLDKVVIFAPADDNNPGNPLNDIKYVRGTGQSSTLLTTGYNNTIAPARPGGLFAWDNGNGTYTAVAWADGTGYVRSTYTLGTDSWTPWQEANIGPVASTGNINQERQIVGASDGSVLFGTHLTDGQVYRSTDQGNTWLPITMLGTNASVRTGRMAYDETSDTLVYSDGNGTYRIDTASGSSVVSAIAGLGPSQLAIDSQGCVYAHERTGGLANLWRFDDFANATGLSDAVQIADETHRAAAGDLANTMTIGLVAGMEVIQVGYQGRGGACATLPEK